MSIRRSIEPSGNVTSSTGTNESRARGMNQQREGKFVPKPIDSSSHSFLTLHFSTGLFWLTWVQPRAGKNRQQ